MRSIAGRRVVGHGLNERHIELVQARAVTRTRPAAAHQRGITLPPT